MVKNSKSFLEKVKTDKVPSNYKTVSYIVKLLFTNVLLNKTINIMLKGCVCYIFGSLFFKSIKEHMWNSEKCFLFHFKSSFCSQEKSDLSILDIQISWSHQMPKHKANIFYWITWKVNSLLMKFGQLL